MSGRCRLTQRRVRTLNGSDQALTGSRSVLGLEVVAAAPIKDRDGAVIGAVCGERGKQQGGIPRPIKNEEALMLQLLARAVEGKVVHVRSRNAEATQKLAQRLHPDALQQLAWAVANIRAVDELERSKVLEGQAAKDMKLAKEEGMDSPGGLAIEESYRKATAAGLGELDLSEILKYLEQKGN